MSSNESLKYEREKLNRLIESALAHGVKIADDDEIQKQSLLVNRLITDAETESNSGTDVFS